MRLFGCILSAFNFIRNCQIDFLGLHHTGPLAWSQSFWWAPSGNSWRTCECKWNSGVQKIQKPRFLWFIKTMQIEKVEQVFSKRLFLIKKIELGNYLPKQIFEMLNPIIRFWWGFKIFVYTKGLNYLKTSEFVFSFSFRKSKITTFLHTATTCLAVFGCVYFIYLLCELFSVVDFGFFSSHCYFYSISFMQDNI